MILAGLTACCSLALAAETKGKPMSYSLALEFLAKHTQVVELGDDEGALVAVCPQWQGRVMTSTCDGNGGLSFGFINDRYIAAGKLDRHFNNFGGEERLWLSPEGGQFSLWFEPGKPQNLDNWFTPPAFNEGAWKVLSPALNGPGAKYISKAPLRMGTTMKFKNTSGTQFHLDVVRTVRLLGKADLKAMLGESAAKKVAAPSVKSVAYETDNRLTNRGADMSLETGLASIWILGMMNSGPETVVIVPYKPGSEDALGPVVKSDYFGAVPAERLRIMPEAALMRADGNYRAKIGVSQRRVRNVLGSIDFKTNVLTLVHFSMPADPARERYMNNQWGDRLAEPYKGDVANSYNDGPPAPGKKGLGPFYEIESLSPAKPLKTGESLSHQHRTIHIQADPATLADLAKEVLGVDLAKVKSEMLAK
jgi:hypothetical protein